MKDIIFKLKKTHAPRMQPTRDGRTNGGGGGGGGEGAGDGKQDGTEPEVMGTGENSPILSMKN